MSIMVLGGLGYIGSAFLCELEKRGLKHINITRKVHDYTNPCTLHQLLLIHQPEFVINAAGYTGVPNVDACESAKAETLMGNTVFPATLALECGKQGIPFGHVSTGCVYNGHPAGGFRETDPPNFTFTSPPCSYYSGTKALAEEILVKHRCYIWRMRMPFNEVPHPKNYLTKLLTYPKLYDNVNSLSHLGECVYACLNLWQQNSPYGIYNVVNPGFATAGEVVSHFGGKFEFFLNDEEFYKVAKAPRSNCILNTDKLRAESIWLTDIHDIMAQSVYGYQTEHQGTASHRSAGVIVGS